jgi:hypothetical protein
MPSGRVPRRNLFCSQGHNPMSDDHDPPIEPLDYLGGVTVVDFGDVRVARGMSRRHHSSCPHKRMVYDQQERRIWCEDCKKDVEAFDACRILVDSFSSAHAGLKRREQAIVEAEAFKIRTLAGKQMDEAWRSHHMVPSCPHCHNGLFPEDFKHGVAMVGKEFARSRKERK